MTNPFLDTWADFYYYEYIYIYSKILLESAQGDNYVIQDFGFPRQEI